jgi:hypothetical protein
MKRDVDFDDFLSCLAGEIEDHIPHMKFGTDEANDRAWEVAEAFAWQLWSEMTRDRPDEP